MSKLVVLDGRRDPPRARPAVRPSRYAHLVPLPDGRSVAWNALSGDLALWGPAEVAAYRKLEQGDGSALARDDQFADRLSRSRNVCEPSTDEVEMVRSLYDRERYGEPVMTLTNFVRGPESAPPQPPMNATVRAGVAALCSRLAGSLTELNALWVGHEPLAALNDLGDLSLRLAEIAAARRLRYVGAVQTDGVALTPPISDKLPALGIGHVEVRLRTSVVLAGLDRILDNLSAALEPGRLELHLRLETWPEQPAVAFEVLDRLAAAGLTNRRGLGLSLGGGVFQSCHRQYGLTASGTHGTRLLEHAHRLGLAVKKPLPRFLSQCQAVRSLSYAVAPNGDLHKCWETVSDPHLRLGNACVPTSFQAPLSRRPRWMVTDPFSDAVCSDCSILPLCAGHCADLFPVKPAAGAMDQARPCPDVKYHLADRILAAARMAGILPQQGDDHG